MKSGYLRFVCIALCFTTIGYVLGTSHISTSQIAQAADDKADGAKEEEGALPDEVQEKIKLAIEALELAKSTLEGEGLYTPATTGINSFAITCGGVDALADLERGSGVDPETFAALYSDKAVEEIAEHISRDDKGRLTYKGKVVRMYPLSRLKQMLGVRSKLTGKDELGEDDSF